MNKIEEWLDEFHNGNTRHVKEMSVTKFFKWYKGSVEDFEKLDASAIKHLLLKWKSEMMDKEIPNNNVINFVSGMRGFAEYLGKPLTFKRGQLPRHMPDTDSHIFRNGDLTTMFNSAVVRDKAMLATAVSLGWEISAFLKLDRAYVENLIRQADERGEKYMFFETVRKKTGERRLGILNPLAIEWLKKWFAEYPGSELWDLSSVRGLNKRLKNLAKRSGLALNGRVRFHKIRGWTMTALLRAGFSEIETKYIMGKSVPVSDMTYLSLKEVIEEKYPQLYDKFLNINPAQVERVVDVETLDRIKELEAQNAGLHTRLETIQNTGAIDALLKRVGELEKKLANKT